jgi:hypothetical protein
VIWDRVLNRTASPRLVVANELNK